MTTTALRKFSPLDPAYVSISAQRARIEHLIDYARRHAPGSEAEMFMRQRLAALDGDDAIAPAQIPR